MSNLSRFLEQAEARLSKEPETDFQHEFLPDLERQAPLSVREAKRMVKLLRAFAAVVEEAREVANSTHDERQDVLFLGALESLSKKVQAADAALAALGEGKA